MIGNFPACVAIILREEGGNDDDPHDPGGRTSRGIIQREWNIYRRNNPSLPEDVWSAPQSDVENIYKTQYWNPYCDELPLGVDLVFFNASVNSGRQQAVKELQRALGVSVDGMMGMETLGEVQAPQDYQALVSKMCDQRRAFYQRLKTFKYFGRGWMARTDRIETAAKGMAPVYNPATAPVASVASGTISLSAKRAMPEDVAKSTIDVGPAAGGSAGSTFLGGLIDQIQGLMDKLSPYQYTMQWIKIACLFLGFVLACVGIYAWYKRYKAEQVT